MTTSTRQYELQARGLYAELLALALEETDNVALAIEAADMAFAQDPWQPYQGPHGGHGWRNSVTGEVVYQQERPGTRGEGGGETAGDTQGLHEQISASLKTLAPEDLQQVAEFLQKLQAKREKSSRQPSAQSSSPDPELTERRVADLQALRDASLNPEISYERIGALVHSWLSPLSAAEALALAKSWKMPSRSKRALIEDVTRRIKQAKGSFDRTNFRGDAEPPESAKKALEYLNRRREEGLAFTVNEDEAAPKGAVWAGSDAGAGGGSGGGTFNQPGDFAPEPREPYSHRVGKGRQTKGKRARSGARKLTRALRHKAKQKSHAEGAAFGMYKGEWHGPRPPSPDWLLVRTGPRGGKVWRPPAGSSTPKQRQRTTPKQRQRTAPRAVAGKGPSVAEMAEAIRAKTQSGVTAQDAQEFTRRILQMKVTDIHELKRSLGLKASGTKAVLVQKLVERSLRGAQLKQEPQTREPLDTSDPLKALSELRARSEEEGIGISENLRKLGEATARKALETHPTLKAAGDKLKIQDIDTAVVQRHVLELAALPEPVMRKLVAAGLGGIFIANKDVTDQDDNTRLKHMSPRGWGSGKTWVGVPGCYNHIKKQAVAGSGGTGSVSVVVHEVGHAIGDLLGVNADPDLSDHHKRLFDKLAPYYQQEGPGGDAGCKELFAEGLAEVVMDREKAVQSYDEEFVRWIEESVLQLPEKTF